MKLYFAKFADGALYATGEQTKANGAKVPGGPVAYVLVEDAALMAQAIGGEVVERTLEYTLDWCKRHGLALYIRQAGGGMLCVDKFANTQAVQHLHRVEDREREAALAASMQMSC